MNDEHKDRVFKYLFGNPANREWTLALYNAVNGSNYENAEEIEYNTIVQHNRRRSVSGHQLRQEQGIDGGM